MWDEEIPEPMPARRPVATLHYVAQGPKRHNARHNKPAQKRPPGIRGMWARHLLMEARQREAEADNPGEARLWRQSTFTALKPDLAEDKARLRGAWSTAAAALTRLEQHGYVSVDPSLSSMPRDAKRRAIRRFRLTPSGRGIADLLLANDGKTPAMIEREEHRLIASDPLEQLYREAHREVLDARVGVEVVAGESIPELFGFISELENELGIEQGAPLVDPGGTAVERAAKLHLRQVRAITDLIILRQMRKKRESLDGTLLAKLQQPGGARAYYVEQMEQWRLGVDAFRKALAEGLPEIKD